MWRSFALASSQLELKHVLKAGQLDSYSRSSGLVLNSPCTPIAIPLTYSHCTPGQSFRWTITPLQDATEEYSLCLPDRLLLLKQTPSQLHYQAIFPGSRHPSPQSDTLPWITDYFQLDVDLVHLESTWSATDPVYQLGKQNGTLLPGVRVLNQDPWECLFSFICSANNNIKRITQMVQSAAEHFSPPLLTHAERAYHPFPPPSAFIHPSTPGVLRTLGFGYRAEYIHRTALALVDSGRCPLEYLQSLRDRPTGEAREALLELTGVGPKVADCVLLMSLGKKEVVPVDVHVVGIAERLYGMKKRSGKGMTKDMYLATQRKLTDVWGDWAGWTQAVSFLSLFFCALEGKIV